MKSSGFVLLISSLVLAVSCKPRSFNSEEATSLSGSALPNLASFIAKSECDGAGGFSIATANNMRLSNVSYEDKKSTLMSNNFDQTQKSIGAIVTDYEFGLLVAYTGGFYRNLNAWLRGDKSKIGTSFAHLTDGEWSRHAMCLASAVNKVAVYQGGFNRLVAYRGAALTSNDVSRYKKGVALVEKGFQSYSFDKSVGINYTATGDDPTRLSVLFILKGTGNIGMKMENISSFPEEKELLISSDHRVCVENVSNKDVGEIDSTHPKKGSKVTVVELLLNTDGCAF